MPAKLNKVSSHKERIKSQTDLVHSLTFNQRAPVQLDQIHAENKNTSYRFVKRS